jgi:hypothetical protein
VEFYLFLNEKPKLKKKKSVAQKIYLSIVFSKRTQTPMGAKLGAGGEVGLEGGYEI